MPRHSLSPRKARAALMALRLESVRREAMASRKDHHARAAALALRQNTPDWVEMDAQIKQLQLEAEMDAMEAAIDAGKPKIPILNFDLMPGFEPPTKPEPEPEVHPNVKAQAALTAVQAPRPINENAPPPKGGKNWKYESTIEGLRPEDDWRNYE